MIKISFKYCCIFFLFFSIANISTAQTKKYLEIYGDVSDLPGTDTINFVYGIFLGGNPGFDSSPVKKGKYYFKNQVNCATRITLFSKPQHHADYLKNQNILSFIAEPNILYVNSTNTFSGLKKNIGAKADAEYNQLQLFIQQNQTQLDNFFLQKKVNGLNELQIDLSIDSIKGLIALQYKAFLIKNTRSLIKPFVLENYLNIINDRPFKAAIDFAEKEYNKLSAIEKYSFMGKRIFKKLQSYTIDIGTSAINFQQANVLGNTVDFKKFRANKYVLIDFWASWCVPCRKESPYLREIHKKYKEKGFDIIGVSLDQNKEMWAKAISEDSLDWEQVSDLQFWKNNAALLYKIASVPTKFLVDTKGIIIGKFIGIEDHPKLDSMLVGIFGH